MDLHESTKENGAPFANHKTPSKVTNGTEFERPSMRPDSPLVTPGSTVSPASTAPFGPFQFGISSTIPGQPRKVRPYKQASLTTPASADDASVFTRRSPFYWTTPDRANLSDEARTYGKVESPIRALVLPNQISPEKKKGPSASEQPISAIKHLVSVISPIAMAQWEITQERKDRSRDSAADAFLKDRHAAENASDTTLAWSSPPNSSQNVERQPSLAQSASENWVSSLHTPRNATPERFREQTNETKLKARAIDRILKVRRHVHDEECDETTEIIMLFDALPGSDAMTPLVEIREALSDDSDLTVSTMVPIPPLEYVSEGYSLDEASYTLHLVDDVIQRWPDSSEGHPSTTPSSGEGSEYQTSDGSFTPRLLDDTGTAWPVTPLQRRHTLGTEAGTASSGGTRLTSMRVNAETEHPQHRMTITVSRDLAAKEFSAASYLDLSHTSSLHSDFEDEEDDDGAMMPTKTTNYSGSNAVHDEAIVTNDVRADPTTARIEHHTWEAMYGDVTDGPLTLHEAADYVYE